MSDPVSHSPVSPRSADRRGSADAMSLFASVTVRLMRAHSDASRLLQSRDLQFEDRPDRSGAVFDIGDNQPIAIVSPGTNGFVRVAMRGLARERRVGDIGEAPFRLTRCRGRLTLTDTLTGDQIELGAFGSTNEEAFARLLTAREASK